tara:strand:+ start:172 stop:507 length:336 start_codon:yes stop_codon:yes gene_type:complete
MFPHQDWKPVEFHKPILPKKKENNQPVVTKKMKELLDNENIVTLPKITNELKTSIQQARLAKKMTQKQLASALNVTIKDIADYENGKAIPNNQFISKLERTLQAKLPRVKK